MTDHADDHHHAHDSDRVSVGLVTVSSSRSPAEDEAGEAAAAAFSAAGHEVVERDLVPDEIDAIRATVTGLVGRTDAELIVTMGGTGVTPDDVTPEALAPLFDRQLPGFGEQFRARSVEDIGPRAITSRATAGLVEDVPVFATPGSTAAVELAVDSLIAPVAGHLVGLAQRDA